MYENPFPERGERPHGGGSCGYAGVIREGCRYSGGASKRHCFAPPTSLALSLSYAALHAGLNEADRRIFPQEMSRTPVPPFSATVMVTNSAESLVFSSVRGTSAIFALGS